MSGSVPRGSGARFGTTTCTFCCAWSPPGSLATMVIEARPGETARTVIAVPATDAVATEEFDDVAV